MTSPRILQIVVVVSVLAATCTTTTASTPLKVICATRTGKAPKIDGVLDDACWTKTEVRSDFVTPGVGKPVQRRTTMRLLHDEKNLYVGLELHWDDIKVLADGIRSILAKHGPPAPGIGPIAKFANTYSFELFIDRDASRVNTHQFLHNAAGQSAGNFNMDEKRFNKTPTVRSTVGKGRWTVELAWPIAGKPPAIGDVWGLNLIRNDEMAYGMWAFISGAFHQPQLFGRVLMGDYAAWWNAVFAEGVTERLGEIRQGMGDSKRLRPLYDLAKTGADRLAALARKHRPTNRENFEILYRAHGEFGKNMTRLEAAYQTHRQMEAN